MAADETEVETVIRLRAVEVRDLFPEIATADASSRVCLLCAAKLKDKTHNLTRHLERHHVGALVQLMEQRSSADRASSPPPHATKKATPTAKKPAQQTAMRQQKQRAVTPTTAPSHGDDCQASSAELQRDEDVVMMDEQQMDHAKRALVTWLTNERLPIGLVETQGFRRFVEALNTKFMPPEHEELRRLLGKMHTEHDQLETTGVMHAKEENQEERDEGNVACTSQSKKRRRTEARRSLPVEAMALTALCRTPEDTSVVLFHAAFFETGLPECASIARLRPNSMLACAKGKCVGDMVSRQRSGNRHTNSVKEQDRVIFGSSCLACDVCSGNEATRSQCSHHTYFGVNCLVGALTEYLVLPIENLYSLPSPTLPDELALLVDDHAVVFRITELVKERGLRTLAIITDAVTLCTVGLFVRYAQQELGFAQSDIHIFVTGSNGEYLQQVQGHATLQPLDIYDADAVKDVLPPHRTPFDGVIDFCGFEASAALAIRAVQPMGTLMFVQRDRVEAVKENVSKNNNTRLAMDMNTVVVSELEVEFISDCSAHFPEAVAYLEDQAAQDETLAELKAFLSPPAALADALEELRKTALDAFSVQYRQVLVHQQKGNDN
uniref:BED-type domain-containing protein n=1 Tax=Globisporangium ultimum (strain ATCC 200006 / CBS 805.95 / DAOM BR144) TaxID=431595 RepID=K3W512_GLOUD